MKVFTTIFSFAVIFLYPIAYADEAGEYEWAPSQVVTADLNRSGLLDSVQLGTKPGSIGLLIQIDSKSLPIIVIPIDGSKQFGICPGSTPRITVVPQSEAPLNALGATPSGYEICPECVEIVVSGGECDPIHFYWSKKAKELLWWRA